MRTGAAVVRCPEVDVDAVDGCFTTGVGATAGVDWPGRGLTAGLGLFGFCQIMPYISFSYS